MAGPRRGARVRAGPGHSACGPCAHGLLPHGRRADCRGSRNRLSERNVVRTPAPPVQLTVTTWNINSVRLRIDLVLRFLAEHRPDVLCLQETKCPDDAFPLK